MEHKMDTFKINFAADHKDKEKALSQSFMVRGDKDWAVWSQQLEVLEEHC